MYCAKMTVLCLRCQNWSCNSEKLICYIMFRNFLTVLWNTYRVPEPMCTGTQSCVPVLSEKSKCLSFRVLRNLPVYRNPNPSVPVLKVSTDTVWGIQVWGFRILRNLPVYRNPNPCVPVLKVSTGTVWGIQVWGFRVLRNMAVFRYHVYRYSIMCTGTEWGIQVWGFRVLTNLAVYRNPNPCVPVLKVSTSTEWGIQLRGFRILRNLPVYQNPFVPILKVSTSTEWGIQVWGFRVLRNLVVYRYHVYRYWVRIWVRNPKCEAFGFWGTCLCTGTQTMCTGTHLEYRYSMSWIFGTVLDINIYRGQPCQLCWFGWTVPFGYSKVMPDWQICWRARISYMLRVYHLHVKYF